jgi:hypothetical protein
MTQANENGPEQQVGTADLAAAVQAERYGVTPARPLVEPWEQPMPVRKRLTADEALQIVESWTEREYQGFAGFMVGWDVRAIGAYENTRHR